MFKEQAHTLKGWHERLTSGLIVALVCGFQRYLRRFKGITTALAWLPGRCNLAAPTSSDQYALLFIRACSAGSRLLTGEILTCRRAQDEHARC